MLCVVHKNTLGIGTAPLYILRMTKSIRIFISHTSIIIKVRTVSYKILTVTICVCNSKMKN